MKNFFSYIEGTAAALTALLFFPSCERVDIKGPTHEEAVSSCISLPRVAQMLSSLPLETSHLEEVHDAVSSSSSNGYDEEYTMAHLFSSPGSGVGDDGDTRSPDRYSRPLRDLVAEYYRSHQFTKSSSSPSSEAVEVQSILDSLSASDVQIYWPWSADWDGKTAPIVTFDPGDESTRNIGYEREVDADGNVMLKEVLVDEEMARERPVWVVNRNSDAGYKTLEMLLKENPSWGEGGVVTVVGKTKGASSGNRSLMISDLKAYRNYDPWFTGASEFFFKMGSVEDFKATTEEEMLKYSPSITDFMVVVRRSLLGETIPFKVILVSDWTPQLEACALMITEDDGGTRTTWNCSATVRVQSKSYGFDISLPFNSRDDIVWRGRLSRSYLEAYSDSPARFGDIEITFSIVEK